MYAGISIYADEINTNDDNSSLFAFDFDSLHVSMAGEALCNGDEIGGAGFRCSACSTALRESNSEGYEYEAVDESPAWVLDCREFEPDEDAGETWQDERMPHKGEPIPGSFANSARVVVGEDDAVTVTISVGDPRGAFAMTVSRGKSGDLFLSVPYEGEGMPHMELKQINPGYYRILR